jgi:KDO2-lipid IV(A) lauroyltransferase
MPRQNAGARAWVEFKALSILERGLQALPLHRAARLGAAIGSVVMKLDRLNRPVAMRNLEIAFPEIPVAQRMTILAGMYRNWGRMAAEWVHMHEFNPANIADVVTYEGREHWDRAAEISSGRGILVVTGHFGNWELLPVAHAMYGTPIAIVSRPIRNPHLYNEVQSRRSVYGNCVVPRYGAAKAILRLLRDNWMVAVPIDLDVRSGVFVDFFSLKACTTDGVARMAMASGAPILPAFMVRQGDAVRHRITVLPPIEMVRDGDRHGALVENTQRFTSVLETMVRRHPDHWNWVHRRWKTRPPGEARFY